RIVHEVKKSDKVENAHKAQVIYYLYVLAKNGIIEPSGIIEYPKLRQREIIHWDDTIMEQGVHWENQASSIIEAEQCPVLVKKSICKSCSYYELCYVTE